MVTHGACMNRREQAAVDAVWGRCVQHLQPALDFEYGLHRIEDVRAAIDRDEAQLWPAPEGTIVSEIKEYPSGTRVLRLWLAGGSLGYLMAAEPLIRDWGRERGCSASIITGRKGWKRVLPDYRHTADVLWCQFEGKH
jgi:hypothetical protein